MTTMLTRRTLIIAGVALSGAYLTMRLGSAPSLAETLRALGQELNTSQQGNRALIEALLGSTPKVTHEAREAALLQQLGEAASGTTLPEQISALIANDFTTGKIHRLKGWVLSEVEVNLVLYGAEL